MPRRKRGPVRRRIGRVSLYPHHGAWWVYYRDADRPVRRRVAESESEAELVAAQINAQLTSAAPSLADFQPILIDELCQQFLTHHELVLKSSLSTVRRYRAAIQHLRDFAGRSFVHELRAERFALFLRERKVSPNGHANTTKRTLRDKGVQYILQTCRSLYSYAIRLRHLPPYAVNPFAALQIDRIQIEDAKSVFVFDQHDELAFLQAANRWSFPVHFTLAKTGLRVGELIHLLIEDLDLETGWLFVRNKPELGWRIKTRNERSVPLIKEVIEVLRHVVGKRKCGPVFLRESLQNRQSPELIGTRVELATVAQQRLAQGDPARGSRETQQKIFQFVWRDAGAIKADRLRTSFLRITQKIGQPQATCPKSWRHTFATLLQDANVDPLIRQITLGHKPGVAVGELGMTAVYTHTRPRTQRQEIERALRLWPASLAHSKNWINQQGDLS